jgi:transposase
MAASRGSRGLRHGSSDAARLGSNHDGVGGLSDAERSGRPPALSAEQMEDLKALVLAGSDLAIHGVTRWRCLGLSAAIADRYGVVVHERTVGKLLRRLGLTRLQPRPYHPRKDSTAQEASWEPAQQARLAKLRGHRPGMLRCLNWLIVDTVRVSSITTRKWACCGQKPSPGGQRGDELGRTYLWQICTILREYDDMRSLPE